MTNFTIITDLRIRWPGEHVLIGDPVRLADGRPGRVVALRRCGARHFLVTAPEDSLSEEWFAKMYRGEFQNGDGLTCSDGYIHETAT
jgi:hypothetical protein